MSKEYQAIKNEAIKNDDPVIAYRNYYKLEKSHFAKWAHSEKPDWF